MMNKKQKIVDVTFELSLKNGFDNVSMKQIQKATELASGSIYYHFENKNAILEYILTKYLINSFNELKKEVNNLDCSFIEKMRFVMEYKVSSYGKTESEPLNISTRPDFNHKDYFILFSSAYHHHAEIRGKINELYDNSYDFFSKLAQEAIKNKEIREDIDIETFSIFIQTILKGYVELWVFQKSVSLEKIIDANIKMIQKVIKP